MPSLSAIYNSLFPEHTSNIGGRMLTKSSMSRRCFAHLQQKDDGRSEKLRNQI